MAARAEPAGGEGGKGGGEGGKGGEGGEGGGGEGYWHKHCSCAGVAWHEVVPGVPCSARGVAATGTPPRPSVAVNSGKDESDLPTRARLTRAPAAQNAARWT